MEKNGLTFDVLSDAHHEVIAAYRVQFTVPADLKDLHLEVFHNDLSAPTADASWDLPIPATYVIDRSTARASCGSATCRLTTRPAWTPTRSRPRSRRSTGPGGDGETDQLPMRRLSWTP